MRLFWTWVALLVLILPLALRAPQGVLIGVAVAGYALDELTDRPMRWLGAWVRWGAREAWLRRPRLLRPAWWRTVGGVR